MKKLLLLCAAFLGLTTAFAAVKPGENILFNGEFSGNAIDDVPLTSSQVPEYWSAGGVTGGPEHCLKYFSGGVPEGTGKGYIRLEKPSQDTFGLETTVSQPGLYLVPGEKYRISALVRTKDFESPQCGIMVYDFGWHHDIGLSAFPKNQDWTRMTVDFEMIESAGNYFTFVIFACNFKGSLDVTDVKLEALTEKGLRDSRGSEVIEILKRTTLIPWKPLLNRIIIPKPGLFDWLIGPTHPELTLLLNGPLPEGTRPEDYDILYGINDFPCDKIQLQKDFNTIQFKNGVTPGNVKLALSIVNRKTGVVICKQEHEAAFIHPPVLSDKGHKRLNNLVIELLSSPIAKTPDTQAFSFCTMRDGWVFIAAQDAAAENLEVTLDGVLTVIKANTPRLETFREIPMGQHTLTVKGAANGGNLLVRSIPEIFHYCPGLDGERLGNPFLNWDFQEKYVNYALTTHNGGEIPEEYLSDFFARGYKWIANAGTFMRSSDDILKSLNTCWGMTRPQYQGVSCDEQLNGSYPSILPFTDAIRRFVPKNDHVTYTWVGGRTFLPEHYDSDFASACINACHGRGRLLFETYNKTLPTKAEAEAQLTANITDIAAKYRTIFPNIMDHFGLILGNFNLTPVITLIHHPNVDYKYYLDMQMNLIANHPACQDMGLTGYWGTLFADSEMARWSFKLTRHYCIEGKKTMLSDEYGFTYEPGHLRNGDFNDGLAGWTPQGTVSTDRKEGYALASQNRHSCRSGQGDTFAVLTKNDSETSSLTQTARGLIPGKMYCLQFAVVDYKDLMSNTFNPRKVGVDVTLGEGAEIARAQTWIHIDKRKKGNYHYNNNVPKINLHHVVFTATKPELTVTIHNAAAAKGEAAAINFVSLNPYLPEN